MKVERFDPAAVDAATARAWAEECATWGQVWAPEGLPPTPEWLLNVSCHPAANERKHWWNAYDDTGRLAGVLDLEWFEAPDNRDRAFVHLDLPPGPVPDGLLDALVRAGAAVAVPAGRTVLNCYVPQGSAVSAWLRARGARLGAVEEVNVARFDRVDRAEVAALAATVPEGYELVRFDGAVPDDLLEPFVRLNDAMNDAPRDDLTMEDWSFTPDRMRTYEAGLAVRGHVMWTVVARHVATGELAGFNQLIVHPEWAEVIENEDTGVSAGHRGHGLGLWLKSVNLLRALDQPGARCVLTWNAASNGHMLRVNRRLGFACEHVWDSWELDGTPFAG